MSDSKHKLFTLTEAKEIGEKLGLNWGKFDVNQFRTGMNAELADGTYNPVTNFASDDPILVGKVVRAHLSKFPGYYTQWAKQEKAAGLEHNPKPINLRRLAKTG